MASSLLLSSSSPGGFTTHSSLFGLLFLFSVDNIFHDCQGTKFSSRGNSNKYSDGYEQGQEDARQGLESNPDIHSSNGQFKKGYEDGYEDW